MRFDYEQVLDWCGAIFRRCGLDATDARVAAELLVRSEARSYASHGLARLPSYVERFASGAFRARPAMRHHQQPGGIVLEADDAIGHVAAARAIELGMEALETGASVLIAVRDCGHMGALGVHALRAVEAGAMCLLGQGGPATMGLPGFTGPAMANNPIAFGCPIPGRAPLIFDMSCSVAARGKIYPALRTGKALPEGWAIDRDGNPTTDPQAALDGALLPTGGYKGMGIAMIVQCLAGGLAGSAKSLAAFTEPPPDAGSPGAMSAFFWLIRPDAFTTEAMFAEQMLGWSDHYTSCGPAARLPGSRGAASEIESRARGLLLEEPLLSALRELAARLDLLLPAGR